LKLLITLLVLISTCGPITETYSQPNLCEQFTDTTFPPSGWTLQYTGTLYWVRATISGFNNGSGSAVYNMYAALPGTNQSLITPVFQQTSAGDSLIMDMSYAGPFNNGQDSLIILASTNSGTTYISVRRMGPDELITCIICTQTVWKKRTFWLPTGTNRIQFLGKSQFGNNLYLDSICILSGSLGIVNISSIASEYSLEQNYPNPFNPSTNIKFSIPKAGNVKIAITDVLGRKITELVNEFKQAGSYSVDFDGNTLSSGIYFYTIESGGFTKTKKMLMIK
jgi:hypothetical protein